jgi:hypothetical protein
MNIKLHEIPVREVVEGYIDSAENGVTGYNGRLNIRPSFQREFIYKTDSAMKSFAQCKRTFRLM